MTETDSTTRSIPLFNEVAYYDERLKDRRNVRQSVPLTKLVRLNQFSEHYLEEIREKMSEK